MIAKRGSEIVRTSTESSLGGVLSALSLVKKKASSNIPADHDEAYEVGASLQIQHGFGCSGCTYDSIQSFQTARNPLKEENCDRVLYRMGKKICIYDPDLDETVFLKADRKNPCTKIHHFSISMSGNLLSVCESAQINREAESKAQISIYSLQIHQKLNTCSYETTGDFICSAFCGDTKYVVALCLEETENTLILWSWKHEKLHKLVHIPLSQRTLKLSCPPSTDVIISVAGSATIKLWYVGVDNSMKNLSVIPLSKDHHQRVIDHAWLTPTNNIQKFAALVESDIADPQKKLSVLIFEATEESVYRESDYITPHFELRQTIAVISAHHSLRMHHITRTSKGFLGMGTRGYLVLYEKTEEKKTSYSELITLRVGDEENLTAATVVPSEGKLVVFSESTTRLISIPLPALTGLDRDLDSSEQTSAMTPADLTFNGYHSQGVVGADIALLKPLLVTISSDCNARVWNYETMRCLLVQVAAINIIHHSFELVFVFYRSSEWKTRELCPSIRLELKC